MNNFNQIAQAATNTSNAISKGFQGQYDRTAIDEILDEANQTGSEEAVDNAIGKILQRVSPDNQQGAIAILQQKKARLGQANQMANKKAALKKANLPEEYAAFDDSVINQILKNQQEDPRITVQNMKSQSANDRYNQIVGNQEVPNQNQVQPPFLPGMQPQSNESQNPFQRITDLSDEKLIGLQGIPEYAQQAKAVLKSRQSSAKVPNKPGSKYAELREHAIHDYVTDKFKQSEEAETLRFSIDSARKAINGDVTGPGFKAVAKNNPYTQLIIGLTPDEALLQAANKNVLSGLKGIFGNKPTEREIFLLLNSMLPSIGKTKEANLVGLDLIERVNDMKIQQGDIVNKLTKDGTVYVADLESKVNSRMKSKVDKLKRDLETANKKLESTPQQQNTPQNNPSTAPQSNPNGKIRVLAPDGKNYGFMTQQQINEAAANNVIFTPVK